MGIELTILKEVAVVSATVSELAAVNGIVCEEISSAEFHEEYASLLADITDSYRVVEQILQPLVLINSLTEFRNRFDSCRQRYDKRYQGALGKPRVNAEFTFEKYLQFRKRKQVKTSYPVLKKTFSRLHDYIDKWIDNDIWLAMTIDTLLKMVYRLLKEVAELKDKDREAAFNLYISCVGNLPPYLEIISRQLQAIAGTQVEMKVRPAVASGH